MLYCVYQSAHLGQVGFPAQRGLSGYEYNFLLLPGGPEMYGLSVMVGFGALRYFRAWSVERFSGSGRPVSSGLKGDLNEKDKSDYEKRL